MTSKEELDDKKNDGQQLGISNVIFTPKRLGRTYTYRAVKSLSYQTKTGTNELHNFYIKKCCRKSIEES